MTIEEREKFYDEKIAPEILRLGKLCQDNGLSFVCGVEYAPGMFGRTACFTADADDGMRMANRVLQGELPGGASFVALTVTTAAPSSAAPQAGRKDR